jgi:hypothetical protein
MVNGGRRWPQRVTQALPFGPIGRREGADRHGSGMRDTPLTRSKPSSKVAMCVTS